MRCWRERSRNLSQPGKIGWIQRTDGHVTLLVAEHLARREQATFGDLRAFVRQAAAEHATYWRKGVTSRARKRSCSGPRWADSPRSAWLRWTDLSRALTEALPPLSPGLVTMLCSRISVPR